jgi:hypothetical protein
MMFESMLVKSRMLSTAPGAGRRVSRLLLKGGLAVLVALAAGLGWDWASADRPPLAGRRAPAAPRHRPDDR